MSEHTKGEWLVSHDEIGTVCHDDDQNFGMFVPHALVFGENKEADLRLIAAAPDLLAALYGLYKVMLSNGLDECDEHETAAAAIAKATDV